MRINSIHVQNFRTLEDIALEFSSYYTAICGKNNSGKTNVIRAIRGIMGENPEALMFLSDEPDFSVKDDHPKWKTTEVAKRSISIDLGLDIDKDHDAGLFQFLTTYLSIDTAENTLRVTISGQYGSDPKHPTVTVKVGEDKYDGFKAQEILSILRSSRIILFHNSTSATYDRFGLGTRLVSFVSGAEQDQNTSNRINFP